jgi:hypothetical protein
MTTKDIAATCTSVYHKTFELELLGSVDDYKAKWESAKAEEPENVWAWLAEYVFLSPRHFAAPAFPLPLLPLENIELFSTRLLYFIGWFDGPPYSETDCKSSG